MQDIKVGSFTGTGAALNVEIGFAPKAFLCFNITDGDIFQMWFEGMASGTAFQGANHDSKQFSLESSNGISTYAGEAPDKTLTGTLSFTSGSASVSGSSTSFLTELKAGDTIKTAGGKEYVVASIASAASLTLSSAATATESGVKAIRRNGRAPGVTVGTTMSESGKTIRYVAFR